MLNFVSENWFKFFPRIIASRETFWKSMEKVMKQIEFVKMCACAKVKERIETWWRREWVSDKLIKQNSHLITYCLTRNVLFKLIAIVEIATDWWFRHRGRWCEAFFCCRHHVGYMTLWHAQVTHWRVTNNWRPGWQRSMWKWCGWSKIIFNNTPKWDEEREEDYKEQ